MKKWFIVFLGVLWATTTPAESDSVSIERLEKAMYQHYSAGQTEALMETTEKLKEACLKAENFKTYYKAWSNQCIYLFNHQQRSKALQVANDIYVDARQRDNKFGLYAATYTMGTMMSSTRQYDRAEESFRKAISYLHDNFPDESAAATYLGLARIKYNQNRHQEVLALCQQALAEPGVIMQHKLTAWTFTCLSNAMLNQQAAFNSNYEKRKKVIEEYGHDDNLGDIVEVEYNAINGHYERALQLAADIQSPLNRTDMMALIYSRMGAYKEAYDWARRFKRISDSVNTADITMAINEYAMQLDVARAENESKDLRLENLKQEQKTRRMLSWGITIITLTIALFLAFILYRRWIQNRHLQAINRLLEEMKNAEHTARQEAEQALQVKRMFLNNISHEMRTPLNAIHGFSHVLTSMGDELGNEERENLSHLITENTDLLTHIIEHMIELSYYDSNTSIETKDTVSVNALCREVISNYQPLAAEGVTLNFHSTWADDRTITSNRIGLERILGHLLENAVRYTPSGRIDVTVDDQATEGMLTFSVSDTGPGIPKENQQTVFSLFTETTEEVKTTGMGLSICLSICRLLGGNIWIDSDYTDGCRVVFEIKQ